ncbi:MAG: citrate synthase, partial [Lachnospiraceae bacterium]|nr:citrate synthase [Lachnospiraceae bacterium]
MQSNVDVSSTIKTLAQQCVSQNSIDPELYAKYAVKRGLRDINGRGVLAGLTDVSKIKSYIMEDDEMIPCEGKLYYQGMDVQTLVAGFIEEDRLGFEETTYLLLFGALPNEEQLTEFKAILAEYR